MRIKKILILFSSILFLTSCSPKKSDEEKKNDDKHTVEVSDDKDKKEDISTTQIAANKDLSDDPLSGQFSLNGKIITLPVDVDSLKDDGYEFDETSLIDKKSGKKISVEFYRDPVSDKEQVVSFTIDSKDINFSLIGAVSIGATKDEIKTFFGNKVTADSTDLRIEYTDNMFVSVVFELENGKCSKITIRYIV